jgi:hypothetical protein
VGEKELREVIARQTAEREAKIAAKLVGLQVTCVYLSMRIGLRLSEIAQDRAVYFDGPIAIEGPGEQTVVVDDPREGDAASQVMRLFWHVVESVELQTDNTLRLRFDGGLAVHSVDQEWDISG